MKLALRRKLEAWLILLAAGILLGRNVHRAPVTSRRDNNDMWSMAEKLEAIAKRISNKYQ
ncbi:hypothetical protein [Pseudomonas thivervalensis]|uniref:hypothetical protein n=1 Tax=Pseudomonas thivervalensis TaxID=86265 RepID=UPI00069D8666|nr:hypothetical protein [Pseudomonas thivervalensis]